MSKFLEYNGCTPGQLVHWIRTFKKIIKDPDAIDATLEQLKKQVSDNWSFRSLEELEEDHRADWWKEEETE